MGEIQPVEELACTRVAGHAGEPVEHLVRERDRVAGCVRVAGPGRRSAVPDRGSHRTHRFRPDTRLVREQHHGEPDPVVAGDGPDPDGQRRRLALCVVGVGDDLRVGVLDPHGSGHGVAVVTDDDHHVVDPGGASGGDRVGNQRTVRHLRQLFGSRGEPVPPPGSEHERDHGARGRRPTLVVRPTEDHHVPTSARGIPDGTHTTHPEREGGDARRRAVVVTASDGVASGHRQDGSGDAVSAQLETAGFTVVQRTVVPDDRATIADRLRELVDDGSVALVVVTGGTGFGPRDVTPEATRDVIERDAPGLAEAMRASGRASTPMADLSRGVCGVRGSTLIVDLPGSPRGATESLAAVLDLLPHALDLLAGDTRQHPAGHGEHGVPAN
jgi:molybdopterin adenylyltransferase